MWRAPIKISRKIQAIVAGNYVPKRTGIGRDDRSLFCVKGRCRPGSAYESSTAGRLFHSVILETARLRPLFLAAYM